MHDDPPRNGAQGDRMKMKALCRRQLRQGGPARGLRIDHVDGGLREDLSRELGEPSQMCAAIDDSPRRVAQAAEVLQAIVDRLEPIGGAVDQAIGREGQQSLDQVAERQHRLVFHFTGLVPLH